MDKKFFIAMMLSACTVLAINYFLHRGESKPASPATIRPGAAFRVLSPAEVERPLALDVDYIDQKIPSQEPRALVTTDDMRLEFSGFGGALASISYLERRGADGLPIQTIDHRGAFERAKSAFLLVLNQPTPYFYALVKNEQTQRGYEVVFETQAHGWKIRKTYLVPSEGYTIDLELDFEKLDQNAAPLTPHLWVPTPRMPELRGDVHSGVVFSSAKDSIVKTAEKSITGMAWALPEMFGVENKYFVNTMIKDPSGFARRGYYTSLYQTLISILEGPQVEKTQDVSISFYLGPKDLTDLNAVDPRLEGLLNFGWLSWLCKLLLQLLEWLYSMLGNYGLAIIALTVMIKIPLLPLSIKGAMTMERYQKHQPAIAHLRKKYRGDIVRQQEEMVRYHKEHNISPASQFLGCLPLLIDLPIIFALYKVLGNYMDLYQAPFIFWITDLSSKDPYYIMPVLAGITMFWQQSLTPVADGKQRIIAYFSSLFMTAVFMNFPAGLVLYWLTKNILTVGEQYLRKNVFNLSK